MPNFKILEGDCRQTLKSLPDESVHCCVTSPPYFGLRDYGCEDQIGLEQTPDAFVEELVSVFREVKRVLRSDGTLWLNLGDSYAGSGKGPAGNLGAKHNERHLEHKHGGIVPDGLKHKDLIGIPWRVAFALQADGWYLRQDIIWHKPNPMPESVQDRCTKAHEYIFLFSKSERYFFDFECLREPVSEATLADGRQQRGTRGTKGEYAAVDGNCGFSADGLRNKRSVWTINTKPYSGAHFATFPPSLIEPCILAGCTKGGTVLDPFGGSGTTAQVAMENNRNAILCELNPDYIGLINRRLSSVTPYLF